VTVISEFIELISLLSSL